MRLLKSIPEMKEARRGLSGTVGFVPTMGYLHDGHLALAKRAREENDAVVGSIFVNPTQFGPREDFRQYPRDLPRDLALLERGGVDFVFAPEAEEMYPAGCDTWVQVGEVAQRLEGAARPGHFRGVATVVAKLFNIVEPTRAYFGQKDAQQVIVIKKMVADLNMNLEVVVVPTVREPDGLAISSRNIYLNPQERKAAAILYQALRHARRLWEKGERRAEVLRQEGKKILAREPLVSLEYFSVADAATLEELETIDRPALASLAARVGTTRLIDNIFLS